MKKFFFILILLTFTKSISAGVCIENTPEIVNFYRSEAVFIGKVLSIKRFYGIPRTQENWNIKYKIIEFEVQNSYKGAETGKKITVINPHGDIDWEDLKLRKGQQWAVKAIRVNGNLIIHTGCGPWSEQIKSQEDLTNWEETFSSLKVKIEQDKQAIVGRIKDFTNGQELENIEINISGDNCQVTVKTDREGLFYVPFETTGEYTIKISFPKKTMFYYGSKTPQKEQLKELAEKDSFTYKINLQNGEINFNQLNIAFY